MNDINIINEKIINDVVNILGKAESLKRYNRLKATNPEVYSYTCNRLGRDVIEYVNSL